MAGTVAAAVFQTPSTSICQSWSRSSAGVSQSGWPPPITAARGHGHVEAAPAGQGGGDRGLESRRGRARRRRRAPRPPRRRGVRGRPWSASGTASPRARRTSRPPPRRTRRRRACGPSPRRCRRAAPVTSATRVIGRRPTSCRGRRSTMAASTRGAFRRGRRRSGRRARRWRTRPPTPPVRSSGEDLAQRPRCSRPRRGRAAPTPGRRCSISEVSVRPACRSTVLGRARHPGDVVTLGHELVDRARQRRRGCRRGR